MSQLKAYPEYKDSGVQWIGEIPKGWNLSKIKYVANINESSLSDNIDPLTEIYYIDIGSVLSTGEISNKEKMLFKDAPSRARRKLKKGDTIVSTVRTYLRSIATINEDKENLIGSTGFAVLTPNNKVNSNYLSYLLHTPIYIDEIVSRSVGVSYPAINSSEIARLECLLPDKEVQNLIVLFLKEKTLEIDNLISDKERLIELLEEKRQAVVTETVTKGLDPDVKMKDSGIEWIGDIPEHWEIKKIKHLIKTKKNSVKTGPFGSQLKNSDMEGKDIKVYNQRTVLDDNFESGNSYISKNKYKELKEFTIHPRDLLITTRGTIGSATIVPETIHLGILHPCLIRIQINEKLIKLKYLLAYFNYTELIVNQVKLMSNSTTIEVIYSNTLLNTRIILPPSIEEQKQINDCIEEKNSRYSNLSSNIKKQISKLKEYRESLIYEAVTGKIDVRDYAVEKEEIY